MPMDQFENSLTALQKVYKSEPHRTSLRECLREIKAYDGGDAAVFLKEHTSVLGTLISLLDCSKVPFAAVEMLHDLLGAGVFSQDDALALVSSLGTQTWSIRSRVKVMQMAFYFMRYDLYSGNEAFLLLRYSFDCLDQCDPGLESAARPVVRMLVEKILKRAVHTPSSRCDLDLARLAEHQEMEQPQEDDGTAKPALTRSLSQEELGRQAPVGPAFAENILSALEYIDTQVQSRSLYGYGAILHQIVRYPNVLSIPGLEESVREHFFPAAFAILKHGRPENKEPVYSALGVIQERYEAVFAQNLQEMYARLPRCYDERDDSFYAFASRLFQHCVPRNKSAGTEMPPQLFEVYAQALSGLNAAKKSEAVRFKFLEQTVLLFDVNSQFFKESLSGILSKLEEARDVGVDANAFIRKGLRAAAAAENRELFERLLGVAGPQTLVDAAIELRGFMKDSWAVAIGRTTEAQRRAQLFNHLGRFSADELGFVIKHANPSEMGSIFDSATDLFTRDDGIAPLELLLRRISDFEVLTGILVRYYGCVQSLVPCAPIGKPKFPKSQDLDPAVLGKLEIEDARTTTISSSPLRAMLPFVKARSECYQKALMCLTQVIRTVQPSSLWDTVFEFIDLHRDMVDLQIPILLHISENCLSLLESRFIAKILGALKRAVQSEDNNTCLNVLFIYQQIGEFLITSAFLEQHVDRLPSTADPSLAKASEDPSGGAGAPQLWREYIITGAVIMRDKRPFIPISVIKHIFSFIKAYNGFFAPADLDFIEKIMLEQLLKISDADVQAFAIEELNEYSKSLSLGAFMAQYLEHLAQLLFSSDNTLAQKAFEGLQFHAREAYRAVNYVVCEEQDSESSTQGAASTTECLDRPFNGKGTRKEQGSGFVIRTKKTDGLAQLVVRVLISSLEQLTTSSTPFASEILQMMGLFSYSPAEIERCVELFHGLIQKNNALAIETAECIGRVYAESGVPDGALLCFSKWLGDPALGSIVLGDVLFCDVILSKISAGMCAVRQHTAFNTALQSLQGFALTNSAEKAIDCIIAGCKNTTKEENVRSFLRTTHELLSNDAAFVPSRMLERKMVEFVAFYHSLLQSYYGAAGEAARRTVEECAPYALITLLTGKPYKNLRLKCYQVLFLDLAWCRGPLVPHLRSVLRAYMGELLISGTAVHNMRTAEIIYIVRCLALLKDAALINSLRCEMNELLLSCNIEILEAVRQCFQVIFE
ncbi:hypothetical protein PAPHI01_0261 [Pancytospora philotis]|nr:hypothetical protein PAPHI01_0261 [Pancytospora philotis]